MGSSGLLSFFGGWFPTIGVLSWRVPGIRGIVIVVCSIYGNPYSGTVHTSSCRLIGSCAATLLRGQPSVWT